MAMKEGLIGRKRGMTQVFGDDGNVIQVSVVEAGPCTIVGIRTTPEDGYDALQIGFEPARKNVTKAMAGHYKKAGIEKPMRVLREVRLQKTETVAAYQVGQQLTVELFTPGELVDVVGVSKGKGFQGGVKRHNWSGGDQSHGSLFHRAPGSIGASSDPSRVFPGHKLPGRMGGDRRTILNLPVVRVIPEQNLILIRADVFPETVRMPLVHQAVVKELAARRAGTHDTKGRSEVSGGGRKPWKQKGTGRARQGSIRATQWKGGGKPFGPTPRKYDKRMPTEMRRAALREALAAKIASGEVAVVDGLGVTDGKTKTLIGRLKGLGLPVAPTLLVVSERTDALGRAARNVPWLAVETPAHASVYQVIRHERVVFEKAALLSLQEALA